MADKPTKQFNKGRGGNGAAGRSKASRTLPAPFAEVPPSFDINDPLSLPKAKTYLQTHGYVVYNNVVNPAELAKAQDLFWEYMENLGTGIKRSDPTTWDDKAWLPDGGKGILYTNGVGQSKFLWFLRGLPTVARAFASVWACPQDQLLTSFDGCCAMRPVQVNEAWRTQGGWYHVDQNGVNKPQDCCFQGIVNVIDCSYKEAPGLVVCPGSHKKFPEFFKTYPNMGQYGDGTKRGDFVMIKEHHLVDFFNVKPVKLCVPAGALIIWNSKTIHCNSGVTQEGPWKSAATQRPETQLDRLCAYVCMKPRPEHPGQLAGLLGQRQKALRLGITTNHWPDEFTPARKAPERTGVPITGEYKDITDELTDDQKRLAGVL